MRDVYSRIVDGSIASVSLMPFVAAGITYRWAVTEVAVKPKLRGQGYGRLLMAEVLADADREGVTLCLEILPDHPAFGGLTYEQLEAWYMRLGFVWNDEGFMIRPNVRSNDGICC